MTTHDATHGAPHHGSAYTGHRVVDEQGHELGKVVDVVYDDGPSRRTDTQEPDFLVVDPGMLRAAHYLPVAGTWRTDDGTIVSPWGKDTIRSAMKAGGDHMLTRDQRRSLEQHYAIGG
jgi:hypothetical protein